MTARVANADYHRNGVSGEGFYVGIMNTPSGRMLLTVFPEYGTDGEPDPGRLWPRVAVVNLDVRMDEDNAWRGDLYQREARAIVAAVNARHAKLLTAV